MLTQSHKFELFADYHQFYLQDETSVTDWSDGWTPQAVDQMLVVADGVIVVGTARDRIVPVNIEVHDAVPPLNVDAWDQVHECSINVSSGRLVIAGCTDYFPDADRIALAPRIYLARILYGKLDALSEDRADGDDHYAVQLWPGDAAPVTTLKMRRVS